MSAASGDATFFISELVKNTTYILFPAMGEYAAERAGTLNISIEGMMLAGCYASVVGTYLTGSPAVGLLCAMAAGLLVSIVHANFSHRLSANTFVVGLVLNALVLGITSYFFTQYPNANNPTETIPQVAIPLLSKIPVIGPSLFDSQWPVYLLFAVVPGVAWLVRRTKWGLEVRASGENPEAADATGIRVNVRRRQTLYLCGLLSGLGGGYLAMGIAATFVLNQTAGVGYIVICAVIFGGWTVFGTIFGSVVFGGTFALSIFLPDIGVQVNDLFLSALPYIAALGAMVFLGGSPGQLAKSQRAPRALARPFTRSVA
jgi:general nucleoside transport system permease protein